MEKPFASLECPGCGNEIFFCPKLVHDGRILTILFESQCGSLFPLDCFVRMISDKALLISQYFDVVQCFATARKTHFLQPPRV
jgi:hypothetical protein